MAVSLLSYTALSSLTPTGILEMPLQEEHWTFSASLLKDHNYTIAKS